MFEITYSLQDVVLARYILFMEKVISNKTMDYLRHKAYINKIEYNLKDEEWEQISDEDICEHSSFAFNEFGDDFENENLVRACKKLTPLQRKVLQLNIGEKHSLKKIGTMLNVSTKAVEQTKSRAMKNIKKYMEEK